MVQDVSGGVSATLVATHTKSGRGENAFTAHDEFIEVEGEKNAER